MTTFLRQRRTLLQMSQVQLADKLGVSQQTVGRWETSGQIPAKYIKDLAILLGARVQDFLPRSSESPSKLGANVVELRGAEASEKDVVDEDAALPFGDVCFRFSGDATGSVRRFPVTWGTLNHIQECLGDVGQGFARVATWIEFQALNNKWVAINTQHVDRVTFVDDDVSAMTEYHHDEVYKAAADLLDNMPSLEEMEQEDFPYSAALVDQAKTFTEELGDRSYAELLGLTIEFASGDTMSETLNTDVAASLEYVFGGSGQSDFQESGFLQLSFRDDGTFEHIRLDGVRYIEASLHSYVGALREEA